MCGLYHTTLFLGHLKYNIVVHQSPVQKYIKTNNTATYSENVILPTTLSDNKQVLCGTTEWYHNAHRYFLITFMGFFSVNKHIKHVFGLLPAQSLWLSKQFITNREEEVWPNESVSADAAERIKAELGFNK